MFHKKYATYCEKCGYIDMSAKLSVCPFCGEALKNSDWSRRDMYAREEWELNWIKDDIDNRFVKNNPLIDQAAYQSRIQQENDQQKAANRKAAIKWAEIERQSEQAAARRAAEQANAPRCPTCGSTDLKKIDALDRAISVSFLGLASGKIGKSFKCNHCGYMW